MKKIIFITLFIALGYQFILAQETQSFKRFNYGVEVSLIAYPLNVFEKNSFIYGIHPSVYYNLNEHFFLQSGLGLENCKYENLEEYELNGNLESLYYIRKYIRISIPVIIGYRHGFKKSHFMLNSKLGAIYNSNLTYYDFVNSSNPMVLSQETYYHHPNILRLLSFARFSLLYSIGLERKINNKHVVGFSLYFLLLHQNQIIRHLWQSNWSSRYQTGIRLNYKFN